MPANQNSMQSWYREVNPLRFALNFVVIYLCRYLPCLPLPEEVMLWLSHGGMVLEGWSYLRTIDLKQLPIIVSIFWLVINDVLDYGFGLHPYLFAAEQLPVAIVTAIGLTLTIFFTPMGKKALQKSFS